MRSPTARRLAKFARTTCVTAVSRQINNEMAHLPEVRSLACATPFPLTQTPQTPRARHRGVSSKTWYRVPRPHDGWQNRFLPPGGLRARPSGKTEKQGEQQVCLRTTRSTTTSIFVCGFCWVSVCGCVAFEEWRGHARIETQGKRLRSWPSRIEGWHATAELSS